VWESDTTNHFDRCLDDAWITIQNVRRDVALDSGRANRRQLLVGRHVDMALERAESILTLARKRRNDCSAQALLRSALECVMAALYLGYCAEEDELDFVERHGRVLLDLNEQVDRIHEKVAIRDVMKATTPFLYHLLNDNGHSNWELQNGETDLESSRFTALQTQGLVMLLALVRYQPL